MDFESICVSKNLPRQPDDMLYPILAVGYSEKTAETVQDGSHVYGHLCLHETDKNIFVFKQ